MDKRPVEGERLQKALSAAGLASRRQVEEWIRAGRITVNGDAALLGQRIGPRDVVRVDGRTLRLQRRPTLEVAETLFLCHRSPGDDLREGLIPRLPTRGGRRFVAISPMPSVDGGLELVTADGVLAAKLQRAVRGWSAEFSVRCRGELPAPQQQAILQGALDDGSTLLVESLLEGQAEQLAANRWYHLRTQGASGKSIRQLFERQGALVGRVMRTSLGPLQLTRDLSRGHFRRLSAEEAALLAAALSAAPAAAPAAATGSRNSDP